MSDPITGWQNWLEAMADREWPPCSSCRQTSTAQCIRCETFICGDCRTTVGDVDYCPDCYDPEDHTE